MDNENGVYGQICLASVTLLCVPMTVAGKVYLLWVYGEALCKLTPYLQGVAVSSSTFTITAMSLDRCLSILHPMKFRSLRTSRNVRVIILLLWLAAMIIMLPLLFVNKTISQQVLTLVTIRCTEAWNSVHHKRIYDFALLFVVCLIPAQIVMVSYILMGKRLWVSDAQFKGKGSEDTKFIHTASASEKRGSDPIRASRRRTAKMCIVVSVVFVICWLPYYCVHIYLDFKRDFEAAEIAYYVSLLIGHLHCITNPILYCFMHKTFRHCVMRMLPCWKSRFLREGSMYGANAFTRYRMSSYRGTFRSQLSQKPASRKPTIVDNPELQRNRQSDDTVNDKLLNNGINGQTDQSNAHNTVDSNEVSDVDDASFRNKTRRNVKLIFSRSRDPSTSKVRLKTFKVVSCEITPEDENTIAQIPNTVSD